MAEATKPLTSEGRRLNAIGKQRAQVLHLRSQLTKAKEHLKATGAELKQAIEELLTETEQPTLPFDEPA